MSNQSDTPRTDAASWPMYSSTHPDAQSEDVVPSDFARQLERELNEALRQRDLYLKDRDIVMAQRDSAVQLSRHLEQDRDALAANNPDAWKTL